MKWVSTEQMEAVRFAYPSNIASPAFVVYSRPTIASHQATYYGYFGPDEGSFPPSLGWRRLLLNGKIFKIVGDQIIAPPGTPVLAAIAKFVSAANE